MLEKIEGNIDIVIEKLNGWLDALIVMMPNLVVAIVVVIGFYLLSRIVKSAVMRLLNRVSENRTVVKMIANFAYVGILIAGTFVALGILNLDKTVTSLLAGAGIIGLAISFAFQDTATNFISGVIMAFRKNFKVGDLIESEGIFGIVQKVSLRATTIKKMTGEAVIVPNQILLQNPLINYNTYPSRRVDLAIGVSYETDLDQVEVLTKETIQQLQFVKENKKVDVFFKAFGGSSIDLVVRFWIDCRRNSQYLKAKSTAIKAIKQVYDQHDIDIPFPITTLDFSMGDQSRFVRKIEKHIINGN